jgi:hypothetical protein
MSLSNVMAMKTHNSNFLKVKTSVRRTVKNADECERGSVVVFYDFPAQTEGNHKEF